MPVFVVLLRAVNVGGQGKVPMADLVAACRRAGLADVTSYIQSGNLVLSADSDASAVERRVEAVIADRFGWRTLAFARGVAEWRAIVAGNPFARADGLPPEKLGLAVFAVSPDSEALARLRAVDAGGDGFRAAGRDIYLALPDGFGRARLSHAVLESRLKQPGTGRNWRTVLKLLDLAEAKAGAG